jgi:hypothetical protein
LVQVKASLNDQDYQVPFEFTGTLDKLTLVIDRPKLSPADLRTSLTGLAAAQIWL